MEKDYITYDFCYTDENDCRTEIDGTYPIFGDESDLDRLENIIGKFIFAIGFPQFGKEYTFCRGVTAEEYDALDEYLKSIREPKKQHDTSFKPFNQYEVCGNCQHYDKTMALTTYPVQYRCALTGKTYPLDHPCSAENDKYDFEVGV